MRSFVNGLRFPDVLALLVAALLCVFALAPDDGPQPPPRPPAEQQGPLPPPR